MKEIQTIYISMFLLSLGACIENNTNAFLFITAIHSLMMYISLNKESKITSKILSVF
jgi:hypothetical protein